MLGNLLDRSQRRVCGIMSGTSLDGIDVVVAQISGSGQNLSYEIQAFGCVKYPDELVRLLIKNSSPESSSVRELSQLNSRLAAAYAAAVRQVCSDATIDVDSLDVIGCHGQTVYHVPDASDVAGISTTSTLQLGDSSVLANLLGVPVVGNFRSADMALGGQGAPLVPYLDFVAFADETENRILLNLGGIANFTLLQADCSFDEVIAFDTGPANMVMDTLAEQYLSKSYDAFGAVAASGQVCIPVLRTMMDDPYFAIEPPKSTGREYFDVAYVNRFRAELAKHQADDAPSGLATAAALTVESIRDACIRFVFPHIQIDRIIASGGGVRNEHLMDLLRKRLDPVRVEPVSVLGVDPDAKEALCFAVLAHEFLDGVPTNLPSVTGASGMTLLGQLAVPLGT